jgi:transcription initiation factor TFIIIB Brf1 subunit/transcription initiation factor TFIIB
MNGNRITRALIRKQKEENIPEEIYFNAIDIALELVEHQWEISGKKPSGLAAACIWLGGIGFNYESYYQIGDMKFQDVVQYFIFTKKRVAEIFGVSRVTIKKNVDMMREILGKQKLKELRE